MSQYSPRELTDILARHREARIRSHQASIVVFWFIGVLCGVVLTMLVTR